MGPLYLNEGIVKQKHHGCQVPNPFLAPEKHLANIADIADLWVTDTEFPREAMSQAVSLMRDRDLPQNERRVQYDRCNNDRQDQARDQT